MNWNSKQIEYLRNTAVRSLVGDDGEFEISGADVLTFLEGTTPVTEDQITNEMTRVQAEYDSQEYARTRATEYPALAEQLDLLFHDMTAGKGTKSGNWYKAVNKVKTDNPKP